MGFKGILGGTFPPGLIPLAASLETWTDMPAALTEYRAQSPRYQRIVDLSRASAVRCTATLNTGGAAGSVIGVQFSTDGGATWLNFDGAGGLSGAVCVASGAGPRVGLWIAVPAAAKGDVRLRPAGIGGDATADPAFIFIGLETR